MVANNIVFRTNGSEKLQQSFFFDIFAQKFVALEDKASHFDEFGKFEGENGEVNLHEPMLAPFLAFRGVDFQEIEAIRVVLASELFCFPEKGFII